jgi:hypothetical protein
MARCAVRAVQRRNLAPLAAGFSKLFRPLLRGRGHRSAMSRPSLNTLETCNGYGNSLATD